MSLEHTEHITCGMPEGVISQEAFYIGCVLARYVRYLEDIFSLGEELSEGMVGFAYYFAQAAADARAEGLEVINGKNVKAGGFIN